MLEQGEQINLRVEVELQREVSALNVGFILANADGLGLFQFGIPIEADPDAGALPVGKRSR